MRIAEELNAIVTNILTTVSRELGSVADRINSCSSDNYVMDHALKMADKQKQCVKGL